MSPDLFLLPTVAALLVWILTGQLRHYAVRRAILDHPNVRSSHAVSTPRGGGLAVAAVSLAGFAWLASVGSLDGGVALALLGGGAIVAGIGWLDDRRGIRARVRLGVHLVAAVWAVAWLGGLSSLRVGVGELQLGSAGALFAVVAIAWAANLANFMDGIDGLATGQAAIVALAAAALLLFAGDAQGLGRTGLVLGGACVGFLPWNRSPARIFLGDAGSTFLGFTLATVAIAAESAGALPLLALVIAYGTFVFDATATLVRRVMRGDQWYRPHREHAYQRLVRVGASHAAVTRAYLWTTAALIVPATLCVLFPRFIPPLFAAALALLAFLYHRVERINHLGSGLDGDRVPRPVNGADAPPPVAADP